MIYIRCVASYYIRTRFLHPPRSHVHQKNLSEGRRTSWEEVRDDGNAVRSPHETNYMEHSQGTMAARQ